MDWLRRLWNVVTGVLPVVPAIQRVVTAVQRVVQQVRTATAQPPGAPPPEANAAARAAQDAAAARARQQQAVQFDRDIGQRADSAPFPAITPAEKRAMRELLASPTNRSLHLLVEPDAQVVLDIARRVPGILETAVQIHGSFKGAFDYLLADGVRLAEEEIAALLEMSAIDGAFSPYPSTLKLTSPEPLWGMPRVIVQPIGPPPPSKLTSPLQNSVAQVGPIPVACLGTGPAAPICFLAVLGGAALVSGLANAIRYQTDSDYRMAMDNAAWELQQLLESPFRTPSPSLSPQVTPAFPEAVRLALDLHFDAYLTALRDFENSAYLYQYDNYEALMDEERARLSAVYVQQLWEDPVIGLFLQDEFQRLGVLAHDVTDWVADTVMPMVKGDIHQVDRVAREFGITDAGLRHDFGDWIEDLKREGHRGTHNERGDFTYRQLRELAREYARDNGLLEEDAD